MAFFLLLFVQLKNKIEKWEIFVKKIAVCVLLAFMCKYFEKFPFWGLEYEDSYAFYFNAIMLTSNIFPSSFLLEGIIRGSINNVQETCTYSGHFILYSTYLSIWFRAFGASYYVMMLANCFCSLVILFILSNFIQANQYWYFGPLAYCSMPIINVFSGSGLAETFSSMCCIAYIWSIFSLKNEKMHKAYVFFYYIVCLLAKRDNIIIFIFHLWFCFANSAKKDRIKNTILCILFYIILLILFLVFVCNVFEIEAIDSHDIGDVTFSPLYFIKIFPSFFKTLFNLKYFSLTMYIFVCICVYNIMFKRERKRTINIILICVCFIVMYSSHFRGYYFLQSESSQFDSFRYLNNIAYLFAIQYLFVQFKRKSLIQIAVLANIAFSFIYTAKVKEYLYYDEYYSRFCHIENVNSYINTINKKTILFSDEILLYQITNGNDFEVWDISLFNKIYDISSDALVLVDEFNKDELKKRSNIQIEAKNLGIVHDFKKFYRNDPKKLYIFNNN